MFKNIEESFKCFNEGLGLMVTPAVQNFDEEMENKLQVGKVDSGE